MLQFDLLLYSLVIPLSLFSKVSNLIVYSIWKNEWK